MSRDRQYLRDILESARLAVNYLENRRKEEFLEDVQLQDSIIRRLEVVGEAARRVSEECRESFPALPWNSMIGMRNIIVHEYDDVDLAVIWNTVKRDLPSLISELEKIV